MGPSPRNLCCWAATPRASTWLLNFNGGTLRAAGGAATTFLAFNNTPGTASAYVYSGGGTIDNNGQSITIGQPLLAPSGNGVDQHSGLTFAGAEFRLHRYASSCSSAAAAAAGPRPWPPSAAGR